MSKQFEPDVRTSSNHGDCFVENTDNEGTTLGVDCVDMLRDANEETQRVCVMSGSNSESISNTNFDVCDKHGGNILDTYCIEHDYLCCSTCVLQKHGECDRLVHLSEFDSEKSAKEILRLLEIKHIKTNVEKFTIARAVKRQRLEKDKEVSLRLVDEYRTMLSVELDRIQREFKTKLTSRYKSNVKSIENDIKISQSMTDELNRVLKSFHSVRDDMSARDVIGLNKSVMKTKHLQNKFDSLSSDYKYNSLVYNIDPSLEKRLKSMRSFGTFGDSKDGSANENKTLYATGNEQMPVEGCEGPMAKAIMSVGTFEGCKDQSFIEIKTRASSTVGTENKYVEECKESKGNDMTLAETFETCKAKNITIASSAVCVEQIPFQGEKEPTKSGGTFKARKEQLDNGIKKPASSAAGTDQRTVGDTEDIELIAPDMNVERKVVANQVSPSNTYKTTTTTGQRIGACAGIIEGMALTTDGEVILADSLHKTLQIADLKQLEIVLIISLKDSPRGVCITNNDDICVSYKDTHKVRVFTLTEKNLELKLTIDIGKRCFGICYKNEQLYVTSGRESSAEIRVYAIDGKLIRVYDRDKGKRKKKMFISPCCVNTSNDGSIVYVGDYQDGVKALHSDGTSTWMDNGANVLRGVWDIAVDGNDDLYVTGHSTNNVFKLPANGMPGKVIVDGLERPTSICHDSLTGMLLIVYDTNQMLLYNPLTQKDIIFRAC